MVRYASRAPSRDHQWATYAKSTSSVLKERVRRQCHSQSLHLELHLVFLGLGGAGMRPTLIGPVGEPVHHMLLLISGRQTQGFAGHARLVVDISVEHIGLA